jgi:AcrR family transcriptional regulator
LLAAGRELFGSKGLYESRIEDLSSRAGIAKGTLYGYFADKEELIRAVVSAGFDELLQAVRDSARGARDGRERTTRVVLTHLEFLARNPDLLRVFHQARGMLLFNRREWRPLRTIFSAYLEGLGDVLESRVEHRRLNRTQRLELAGLVFGAVSGAVSVHAALVPGGKVKPMPAQMADVLVDLGLAYEARVVGGSGKGRGAR